MALISNQESTPMNDFMSHAVEQARIAQSSGDLPFGAVVVCDNKIVGYGRCTDGTTGDVTDHAEMNALRMACKKLQRNKLQDCEVYSTSEPCPMCASALFQAKIPKIIMGVQRRDLLHLLRQRTIGIEDLAQDSGYDITLEQGTHSAEILDLFAKVDRKKAKQLHPSK